MEQPLLFGRLLRILFGVATLVSLPFLGPVGWLAQTVLALLGVSFLVGGIVGNPGCEVTALPNLMLRKRVHCF